MHSLPLEEGVSAVPGLSPAATAAGLLPWASPRPTLFQLQGYFLMQGRVGELVTLDPRGGGRGPAVQSASEEASIFALKSNNIPAPLAPGMLPPCLLAQDWSRTLRVGRPAVGASPRGTLSGAEKGAPVLALNAVVGGRADMLPCF